MRGPKKKKLDLRIKWPGLTRGKCLDAEYASGLPRRLGSHIGSTLFSMHDGGGNGGGNGQEAYQVVFQHAVATVQDDERRTVRRRWHLAVLGGHLGGRPKWYKEGSQHLPGLLITFNIAAFGGLNSPTHPTPGLGRVGRGSVGAGGSIDCAYCTIFGLVGPDFGPDGPV